MIPDTPIFLIPDSELKINLYKGKNGYSK